MVVEEGGDCRGGGSGSGTGGSVVVVMVEVVRKWLNAYLANDIEPDA